MTTEGLCFDDVLLIPRISALESRSVVSLRTMLGTLELSLPIVSANMDSITWVDMAADMHLAGGLGILHRYASEKDVLDAIKFLRELKVKVPAIPSIGVGSDEVEKAKRYVEAGASAICIDVAHGHSLMMLGAITALRQYSASLTIVAGNIATAEAAQDLSRAGANVLKVGTGPGSMCTTRIVTGHGVPQLTAIQECAKAVKGENVQILADGGMRNSGDIVKALAAGAHAVMTGSLLAGTDSAPLLGRYRGMASAEAQTEFRGKVNNDAPEGEHTRVEPKGPVSEVMKKLAGGIRSGFSYSGAASLGEFHEKARFMRVSANTVRENGAHGKQD